MLIDWISWWVILRTISYNFVYGTNKQQLRILAFPLRERRWRSSYSTALSAVNCVFKHKGKTALNNTGVEYLLWVPQNSRLTGNQRQSQSSVLLTNRQIRCIVSSDQTLQPRQTTWVSHWPKHALTNETHTRDVFHREMPKEIVLAFCLVNFIYLNLLQSEKAHTYCCKRLPWGLQSENSHDVKQPEAGGYCISSNIPELHQNV